MTSVNVEGRRDRSADLSVQFPRNDPYSVVVDFDGVEQPTPETVTNAAHPDLSWHYIMGQSAKVATMTLHYRGQCSVVKVHRQDDGYLCNPPLSLELAWPLYVSFNGYSYLNLAERNRWEVNMENLLRQNW